MSDQTLFDTIEDRGALPGRPFAGEGGPAPRAAPRSPALRSLEQARADRDAAMQQVAEHAPVEWKDRAWSWLLGYLRAHAEFFPDDVWAAGCPVPPERRAFGPLVLKASRAGLIVRTGRTRPRTLGHATSGDVWRSTVYQEASA
jgi:hypothetical protein